MGFHGAKSLCNMFLIKHFHSGAVSVEVRLCLRPQMPFVCFCRPSVCLRIIPFQRFVVLYSRVLFCKGVNQIKKNKKVDDIMFLCGLLAVTCLFKGPVNMNKQLGFVSELQ